MIDVETTGLNPGVNHITSCAIVSFELETGLYGEDFFHERLRTDFGSRARNADTIGWRNQHGMDKAEADLAIRDSVQITIKTINDFLFRNSSEDVPIVWAKPAHFDIAFLESYFREVNLRIPWSHRNVRDLATYLMAAGHDLTELYDEIEFSGDPHNALHDCHYQILLANLGYQSLHKN